MTEKESIIKENIDEFAPVVSYNYGYLDDLNLGLPSVYRTSIYKSGKTYSNVKESIDDATTQTILQELKEFRSENKDSLEDLKEANIKITKLQEKLMENTQTIGDLLLARKNAKRIYFIGLFTGITSGIGGAVFNNFIYIIVGAGVALTAIAGLWEAKQNDW